MLDINKQEWERVKIGDYWRYVDHKNKLLTTGFKYPEGLSLDIIRVDKKTVSLMSERYSEYF